MKLSEFVVQVEVVEHSHCTSLHQDFPRFFFTVFAMDCFSSLFCIAGLCTKTNKDDPTSPCFCLPLTKIHINVWKCVVILGKCVGMMLTENNFRRFVKQAISNLLPPPGIDARPSSTTKQFAATVFWGPAYLQIAFGHNLSIAKDSWFSQ